MHLLDVQADLLDDLATRVVVSLVVASAIGKAVQHLNPEFTIGNEPVFMSTAELAGIPVRAMGERVGSLKDLCRICDHYFGEPRQKKSSHRIYKTPWIGNPRINIQNDKGKAKAYQVKQVLLAVEKLEVLHGPKK